MANRYWVGGSGNWTDTARWSATSGGAGGATVPGTADSAIFDANSDSGSSFIVTLTGNVTILSLNMTGIDQNISFTGAFSLTLTANTTFLLLSGTKTMDFSGLTGGLILSSTGSSNITSNGGTLTGNVTLSSASMTIVLNDAFTMTGAVTHSSGVVNFGGFTWTCREWYRGTTLTSGMNFNTAGGKIVCTGTAATVTQAAGIIFGITSATGFTLTNPANSSIELTGNSLSGIRTINIGITAPSTFNIKVAAGTDTVTFSASAGNVRNLDFTGFSGTLGTTALSVGGNLTLSSTMTVASTANAVTFVNTATTTNTITSNGTTLNRPVTINGAAANIVQAVDALNIGSNTFTHTLGTVNITNVTLTCSIFNTNNANTRSITFGTTGKIVVTAAGTATPWTCATTTGFSTSGTSRVEITPSDATGVKTINNGGTVAVTTLSQAVNFYVPSATGITVSIASGSTIGAMDFTGSGTNTFTSNACTIRGDLILLSTTTFTASANLITFDINTGTTAKIATGGNNINCIVTKTGLGTLQLQDNLSMGVASSRTFTLTQGVLDLQSYTFTLYGIIATTNTNSRSIIFNTTGNIKFTFGTTATLWDSTTATNLNVAGVPLNVEGPGAVTKTIIFGGIAEANTPDLIVNNTAASTLTISGNVRNITVKNVSQTLSLAGATNVYGNFTVEGSTPTITTTGQTLQFLKSSGTQTITTSGKTFGGPVTKNGLGTLQLLDAWTVGAAGAGVAFTLTQGTLDINGYTLTINTTFNSSNANVRRLQNTGGNDSGSAGKIIIIMTTTGTPIGFGTTANMSTDGNVLLELQGNASTGAIAVSLGTIAEANTPPSFYNNRTAGALTINGDASVEKFTSNFASTMSGSTTLTVYDNFVVTANGTFSGKANFAKNTGTQTITTNSRSGITDFTKSGDGTLLLLDNLANTGNCSITGGTLDIGPYTLTSYGLFSSNTSNVRTISYSSGGKIELFGTDVGSNLVWNATYAGNLFFTNTSLGVINIMSSGIKTFLGGNGIYPTIDSGGNGILNIGGNNTFYSITNSMKPSNTEFVGGTTTTFTNDFAISGNTNAGSNVSTYVTSFDTNIYTNYTGYTISSVSPSSYTVEFFIKFRTLSNTATGTNITYSTADTPAFAANTTGWFVYNAGFSARGSVTGITLATDTWYHIAYIGKDSNTWVAINGVPYNLNSIGGQGGYSPNGIWTANFKLGNGPIDITNFRITDDGYLYPTSSNFIPPTLPLHGNYSNTRLLCINSPYPIDQSPRGALVTYTGVTTTAFTNVVNTGANTVKRSVISSTTNTPFTLYKDNGTDVNVTGCDISYSIAQGANGVTWRSYNTLGDDRNINYGYNTGWVFGDAFSNFLLSSG